MCEKCKPIDDKIAHYQFLRKAVLDQQTVDGIEQLIQELECRRKSCTRRWVTTGLTHNEVPALIWRCSV
jgi:hypothetical protein